MGNSKSILTSGFSVVNDELVVHKIPSELPILGNKSDVGAVSLVDTRVIESVHGSGFINNPNRNKKSVMDSIGDILIYNRIWVEPLEVASGFITEESETNIYIWNAEYGSTATIESLTSVLPDGTSFSLDPADTPLELGIDAEIIYVVTVEKPGPPIQDTYYTITIEGIEYEIYVHGTRVIPIDQEPDWRTPPTYRYRFQTVVASSPTFQEQRRSLTNRMLREALIDFTIQNNLLNRFINDITYGHDKVFGVPIYSEASVLSTQATSGSLTLLLNNTTDYYWNLNNLCTHVIIIDYENDIAEIKEVDTVNSTNIVLSRNLIYTYEVGTVVFPCFFASLKGVKSVSQTDNIETINIEFGEFLLGSAS